MSARGGQRSAHELGDESLGRAVDRALLRRIFACVWPYRRRMLLSLVLLPLAALLELGQPYVLKVAIDQHIAVGRPAGLDALALAFLGLLIGQYVLQFWQTYLMQLVGQRSMHDLRLRLYRHVLRLEQAFFDRTAVGRLMTRLTNDIEALSEMFASGFVSLVADVLKVALILATMFALDARLAFFSLASAPLLALVAAGFRRFVREAFRQIRTRMALLSGFLQEHLGGIKVVQAFAQEPAVAASFDAHNQAYRQASARAISSDAALYAIVEAIGSFAVAGLIWHGGGRIVQGTLTFGILVAFIEYLQKLFAPIRDLSTKYTTMQQAMAAAERVFALLDTQAPDAPHVAPAITCGETAAPLIRFENVHFGYRAETPVLAGIDFEVQAGQTIALVGPTGGGKSSIVKLLCRFYDPQAGRILLSGVDIRTLSADELRTRVVMVGQDAFIFSGDLLAAIGLGRADPDGVAQAAARAGLAPRIAARAEGWDTPVAPRGANFSAGERQLLALARALACDPEILILDEATANVDPETERAIEAATAELMANRTALVIAHRLSTITRADRILVIDGGRIVESGRLPELLAAGGVFARLYAIQLGAHDAATGEESPAGSLLALPTR